MFSTASVAAAAVSAAVEAILFTGAVVPVSAVGAGALTCSASSMLAFCLRHMQERAQPPALLLRLR